MKRLLVTSLLLCLTFSLRAEPWPKDLPDPCLSVKEPGDLTFGYLPNEDPVTNWNLAYPASFELAPDQLDGVVFLVNANMITNENLHYEVYADIAEHLARQRYLVRIISRPGGSYSPFFIEEKMQETFDDYSLPDEFPVVLVGHSKGGGSVIEVTRLFAPIYNIEAVVSIAPNADNLMGFMGADAPAFLALYGSQDEDMAGTNGEPREAFMAYDIINTESTTASALNPNIVITPNSVDKAMIYVFGADHSGFINSHGLQGGQSNTRDYLSKDDQFCIGKAYISAFLEWQLGGMSGYRSMFLGEIAPSSVADITTVKPDYFGNPAGAPVQLYQQFSPHRRFVIANHWTTPTMIADADSEVSVVYPYAIDSRARHYTKTLGLHWKANRGFRVLEIEVPANRRRLANFDRLLLRIGQIDSGQAEFANSAQQEPIVRMSLIDGRGDSVYRYLNDYGPIPWADRRYDRTAGHSHMNTISIPMEDLSDIDLNDVRYLRFWLLPKTRGEVMIDNIEAAYD